MISQTCMFKIDEKNIDVIFEVCCMALHLIGGEIERNQRLRNSHATLYLKHSSKNNYKLAEQLYQTAREYNTTCERLDGVMKTLGGIIQMQFDKCSFGFEISGVDVPVEHMNTILAYAREHRNTLENSV